MSDVAIITGGSSGLGRLIFLYLQKAGFKVHDWSLETDVDVTSEDIIKRHANYLTEDVAVLVNCAGANYLDYITKIPTHQFDNVMDVNARALFLIAKYLVPRMTGGTICNIISNASDVPMTHSIAYNASKGAAKAMTRQMARELWQTHNITVFGVSPNKLAGTAMSNYVHKRSVELRGDLAYSHQLSKLLLGQETNPAAVAEFVGWLLAEKHRHFFLAGSILEYGI